MELEELFLLYQGAIFTYFVRLTGNAMDAEELSQETFVRACAAAVRFRGDSSMKTWLFAIARRVWLEYLRRRKPGELQSEPQQPGVDLDERMDLASAFSSLSEEDREVLTLIDILGFPSGEAAKMNGVSPEALRVRLHRARTRLRAAYQA